MRFQRGSRIIYKYQGLIILFFALLSQAGFSQLFPGMAGEALADAIRQDYTPTVLLDDTAVKDTLYAKVFFLDDSVRCIYSGLSRFLPNDVDPSQWLFNDGTGVESINLEHGWPKSKGAEDGTGGSTNMYHLYPSRSGINSDRAAHPYGEIEDHQTSKWYYKSIELSIPPAGDRSMFSEYINGRFEPRETVKGDIARAMFYFWTIYRSDAMAADPFYFDSQLDDLCLWHQSDPVDENELARNDLIAQYQGGVDNPFIVDCSLVMRAYCAQLEECEIVSVKSPEGPAGKLSYLPQNRLVIDSDELLLWDVRVFDVMGRQVYSTAMYAHQQSEFLPIPSGFFIAVAMAGNTRLVLKIFHF